MIVAGEHPPVHNVVVCTLCSCYPWPVLGLPPAWYKSPDTARGWSPSRGARSAEMGLELPAEVRDQGLGQLGRGALPGASRAAGRNGRPRSGRTRELVTRDSMIGVGRPLAPGAADDALTRRDRRRPGGPVVSRRATTARSFSRRRGSGGYSGSRRVCRSGGCDWETFRQALDPPIAEDADRPYWESWAAALEDVLEDTAVLTRGELDEQQRELLGRPAGFDHHT